MLPPWLTVPASSPGAWLAVPAYVVADGEHLVSYIATGAEFGFPTGNRPTPGGRHPRAGRRRWSEHRCLMTQPVDERYAVWHFWDGPVRTFRCWNLNIETAFVRTELGYDAQDIELDIVVAPDGSYVVKDDDVMDDRISDSRFSAETVAWICRQATIAPDVRHDVHTPTTCVCTGPCTNPTVSRIMAPGNPRSMGAALDVAAVTPVTSWIPTLAAWKCTWPPCGNRSQTPSPTNRR